MDYDAFYSELYKPLESSIGPIDAKTLVAIIGFDAGGPLNFCTIGYAGETELATYVSCELAVRPEQKPASFGRYELLTTCDSMQWVRSTITALGHATMELKLGHRHTLDISIWVDDDAKFQGLLLERESTAKFDRKKYGVMRVIGLTRAELDFAVKKGVPQLITKLKKADVYPNTLMERESVV